MKKNITFLLAIFILLSSSLLTVNAQDYVQIYNSEMVKVIEVIDGEVFVVEINRTGDWALLKLIGVNAKGNLPAIKYLNNTLLGETVSVSIDRNMRDNSRWNFVYMYKDNLFINDDILSKGFAKLNEEHNGTDGYPYLYDAQRTGIRSGNGVWRPEEYIRNNNNDYRNNKYNYNNNNNYYNDYNYYGNYGNVININTATTSQLTNNLYEVNSTLARAIVSYRNKNTFTEIRDIYYVDGITDRIANSITNYITVSTNINNAYEKELSSLGLSQREITNIINYRARRRFTDTYQLYTESLISESKYNTIKNFINVSGRNEVTEFGSDLVVNINTASQTQLKEAGFSTSDSSKITGNRGTYSYKTLGELTKFTNSPINSNYLNSYSSRLKLKTDINKASLNEIRSLTGSNGEADKIINNRPYRNINDIKQYLSSSSYNKIERFIYVDYEQSSYININTASYEQLITIGFNSQDAYTITNYSKEMKQSSDIPVSIGNLDSRITLFTNINTAGSLELQSLGFSPNNISNIIKDRGSRIFETIKDVDNFMAKYSYNDEYEKIKNYIVTK
jgi:competence ComEA-like helix-hairpin-helix protein